MQSVSSPDTDAKSHSFTAATAVDKKIHQTSMGYLVRSHLLHRSLAIPKDASTVSHLVPQSIPAFALFPLCSCERMVAGRR
uniref:Uncharacterized protein n=1 Tax=Heterorhabditis bacteriophora TaxID=37862 RepID=A0A1I7XTT0_HETBA